MGVTEEKSILWLDPAEITDALNRAINFPEQINQKVNDAIKSHFFKTLSGLDLDFIDYLTDMVCQSLWQPIICWAERNGVEKKWEIKGQDPESEPIKTFGGEINFGEIEKWFNYCQPRYKFKLTMINEGVFCIEASINSYHK